MIPCWSCGQTRQGTPDRVKLFIVGSGHVWLCRFCERAGALRAYRETQAVLAWAESLKPATPVAWLGPESALTRRAENA